MTGGSLFSDQFDSDALEITITEGVARARREGHPVLVSLTYTMTHAPKPLSTFAAARGLGLEPSLWARPDRGTWMVGVGSAHLIPFQHGGSTQAKEAHHALVASAIIEDSNGPGPVFFGGFRFDSETPADPDWAPFAAGALVLPRWAVSSWKGQSWCTVNLMVDETTSPSETAAKLADESDWLDSTQGATLEHQPGQVTRRDDDQTHWRDAVTTALASIHAGDLSKVTLTRGTTLESVSPFSPETALRYLMTEYPTCQVFAIGRGGLYFLGATPEDLVRLEANNVQSICLAGSAPRGITPEEDRALADALMGSDKEQREHALVVEWVVERMRPLCEDLHSDGPRVTRLPNVQHLATMVAGTPKSHANILDFVDGLHPTPAVGGVPIQPALEHIRRLEGRDRGWYTGPIGWVDRHGHGEFGVALRCALLSGTKALLYAGAGIVDGSDPDREYSETEVKLKPLLSALGAA